MNLPLPQRVGQKICPTCRNACSQIRMETETSIEWQIFCIACYYFERIRIPKADYVIRQPVGMSAFFFTAQAGEIKAQVEENKQAIAQRFGDLKGVIPF
jgi:hypothetical protein